MAIKFATKSNTKGEGVFSLEDFKEIGSVKKRVSRDLTYKDGSFTIASDFVKDQTAEQGWSVGIDEDEQKVYLVRTTLDGEPKAVLLKGEGVSRKFTSDALEVPLKAYGVNLDLELFLNEIETNVYEVSNTRAIATIEEVETVEVEPVARDNDENVGVSEEEIFAESILENDLI